MTDFALSIQREVNMSKRSLSLMITMVVLLLSIATAVAADVDIVISEIMINAVNETSNVGEWTEIYNRGIDPVDLTGWQLVDNSGVPNTITPAMCPGNNCQIPADACWLVAVTAADLQAEFNNYTTPAAPTVDAARTIFLGARVGNGLANTDDRLILRNSSGTAVDCYSWDASGSCAGLTYVNGGGGVDDNFDGENGQSVTNVQGTWYDHAVNGSPYDCINTAAAGPTAVSLQSFQAQSGFVNTPALIAVGLASSFSLAALIGYRQRKVAALENR
jgi:hypothetical protein